MAQFHTTFDTYQYPDFKQQQLTYQENYHHPNFHSYRSSMPIASGYNHAYDQFYQTPQSTNSYGMISNYNNINAFGPHHNYDLMKSYETSYAANCHASTVYASQENLSSTTTTTSPLPYNQVMIKTEDQNDLNQMINSKSSPTESCGRSESSYRAMNKCSKVQSDSLVIGDLDRTTDNSIYSAKDETVSSKYELN